MDTKIIKNLNKIVKGALNLVAEEAFVFPNLQLKQVLSKGFVLPNNKPPIFNKILYLCSKNHIKISEDEKKIIKIIYEIRNKLYHVEPYLTHLLGMLARKFRLIDPTLVDIAKFSKKFSLIVELIILRFFKIIPNYFDVEQNDYFYYLRNKVINLPSLEIRRQQENEFLEEQSNMSGLTDREITIKRRIYDKKDLLRRGKYISIIKFLSRFKLNLQDLTQNNYVSGSFRGIDRTINVNIKLKGNLKGELEFLTRDIAEINSIRQGAIKFQSNLTSLNKNFGMEFIPLLERTTHSFNTNPTGEFLTFIVDVKEVFFSSERS